MSESNEHRLQHVRDVSVHDGIFRIHYGMRADFSESTSRHGIVDMSTIDHYADALERGYPLLTSPRFGWRGFESSFVREVGVRDLGAAHHGIANPDGNYLVLASRPFKPSLAQQSLERFSTVVHELVHLLQFESPLFRKWFSLAATMLHDPNWWLHEAVALAMEFKIGNNPGPMITRLWDWATQPSRSIDSDQLGFRGLPLALYLMDRFGDDFLSKLYFAPLDDNPHPRAADVLAGLLPTTDRNRAAPFEGLFLDYASIWSPGNESMPDWAKEIVRLIGYPARTCVAIDSGTSSHRFSPIEHLGFRILELETARDTPIALKLQHVRSAQSQTSLAARLFPSIDATRIDGVPTDDGRALVFPSMQLTGNSSMVIANTAYRAGWAMDDKSEIELSIV